MLYVGHRCWSPQCMIGLSHLFDKGKPPLVRNIMNVIAYSWRLHFPRPSSVLPRELGRAPAAFVPMKSCVRKAPAQHEECDCKRHLNEQRQDESEIRHMRQRACAGVPRGI